MGEEEEEEAEEEEEDDDDCSRCRHPSICRTKPRVKSIRRASLISVCACVFAAAPKPLRMAAATERLWGWMHGVYGYWETQWAG